MYKKFCDLLLINNVKAADVARATGIPQSTFTDWKKGRSNPKIEKLKLIADYFKVPIDYFTAEEDLLHELKKKSLLLDVSETRLSILQGYLKKELENENTEEMKLLIDTAKECSPEDIKKAAEFLMFLHNSK